MKKLFFILSLGLLFLPPALFSQEKGIFTLEEVIRIGLEKNPGLAAGQNEVLAKQEALAAAKRLINPEFEFEFGEAESHDGFETRKTNAFAISQPIENPFKRRQRILIFENEWEASKSQFDNTRLSLIYDIKQVFFRILFLDNIEGLARKNADSIAEIQGLIERRAQLGEVKELDAIKLRVETLKAQNELNRIQTEKILAKNQLNVLLDNSLPEDFSVLGELTFLPIDKDEESLVTQTLLSYPMIKKKEFEVEAARNNVGRLRWKRFPDFTLMGFRDNELDGINKGLGISVDIPLWNLNSKDVREAEYLAEQRIAELKALRNDISAQVKSKLNKIHLSERILDLFHSGLLEQADQSLKIAEISYREGEISLIDFLDSQRSYYAIMFDYQNSLFTWNLDKAALEKTIGEDIS